MLDVLGQPRAVIRLQRSLAVDRLAHGWVFAGPMGVGKFRLALRLAEAVLCAAPKREPNAGRLPGLRDDFVLRLACGQCESCRAVHVDAEAADCSSHPDIHIIRKENKRLYDATGESKSTTLSVQVIRAEITGGSFAGTEYESPAFKKSILGRGKFFIVDEAELMETAAQNVLLKTLEEPPPQTFIILVTSEPEGLLSTIRSRAQMVPFRALPDEVITFALAERYPGHPPADMALLARLAAGSLGQALHLASDIQTIEKTLAEKAGKSKEDDDSADDLGDEDSEAPASGGAGGGGGGKGKKGGLTPGGVLAWTREITRKLDGLLEQTTPPSEVAAALARYAAEHAELLVKRDKLSSAVQANRNGLGLMLAITAQYFDDRLRQAVGRPHASPLPTASAGIDPHLAQVLLGVARHAEALIDLNANQALVLSALVNEWDYQLHAG